jgi:hypothetical protein
VNQDSTTLAMVSSASRSRAGFSARPGIVTGFVGTISTRLDPSRPRQAMIPGRQQCVPQETADRLQDPSAETCNLPAASSFMTMIDQLPVGRTGGFNDVELHRNRRISKSFCRHAFHSIRERRDPAVMRQAVFL